MDLSLVILLALAGLTLVFAFAKDRSLPMQGLYASGRLFGSVWVELLLGFIIAGLLEVLIAPSEITAWLGTESSMRGILVGWMAGLVIPGGPYLLFPIAANLLKTGAAPGALIALITAKTLVGPIRMLTYEAPLLGWPLTLARCVPALFVPPILGIAGQWLFNLLVRKSP
ncbi:MAG: permease [Nitrospiraceae bacterium]